MVTIRAEERSEGNIGACRRVSYTTARGIPTNAVVPSDTPVEFAGSIVSTNTSVSTATTTTVTNGTSTPTFVLVLSSEGVR